jgi:molybdopterin synthase sulfur carrier subunit
MIRILIPTHLGRLAEVGREIELVVQEPVTINSVLEALEGRYPMLVGTLRDPITKERRDFIRFFACGEDISLEPPDSPLPEAVVSGAERLRIVGAMAGG